MAREFGPQLTRSSPTDRGPEPRRTRVSPSFVAADLADVKDHPRFVDAIFAAFGVSAEPSETAPWCTPHFRICCSAAERQGMPYD
jgi:hypothetical protein